MMQQISLWDAEVLQEEWHTPDDILIRPIRYVDNDITPAVLERLALVVLGDKTTLLTTTGERILYRIITTAVIGNQVLAAHEYVRQLSIPIHDDEEEEIA